MLRNFSHQPVIAFCAVLYITTKQTERMEIDIPQILKLSRQYLSYKPVSSQILVIKLTRVEDLLQESQIVPNYT